MKKYLIILCLFSCLSGYACRCREVTIEEGIRFSEIVVKGKVISAFNSCDWSAQGLKYDDSQMTDYSKQYGLFPLYFITIEIEKVYKGSNLPDTVTILSTVNGASCGFRDFFDPGESYIIYAHSEDILLNNFARSSPQNFPLILYTPHFYWTDHCTRTWMWSEEEEEGIMLVVNSD